MLVMRSRLQSVVNSSKTSPTKSDSQNSKVGQGVPKWILVACFGYQGFSNAKFGRIECHEAINAFAREILLTVKQRLEAGGWRVVHGIVDSIWVTPDPDVDDSQRRTSMHLLMKSLSQSKSDSNTRLTTTGSRLSHRGKALLAR